MIAIVSFLRGSLVGLETRSGSHCYSLLITPSELIRSAISCLFCHRDAVDVFLSQLQMLPLKCRCSSVRPKTSAERSNRQRDNGRRERKRERENKQMLSLWNYLQTLFIKLTTSFA